MIYLILLYICGFGATLFGFNQHQGLLIIAGVSTIIFSGILTIGYKMKLKEQNFKVLCGMCIFLGILLIIAGYQLPDNKICGDSDCSTFSYGEDEGLSNFIVYSYDNGYVRYVTDLGFTLTFGGFWFAYCGFVTLMFPFKLSDNKDGGKA